MRTLNPLEVTLERVFHIRREESSSALTMALFFFIAIASVCLIKPLQIGLYLVNVGVDYRLPLIYIVLAILSGPLVLLYRSLNKRYSLVLLTSCTIAFLTVNLLVFWFLLARQEPWIYVAFYFWGAVYAVLLPTQGWFLSYRIYSAGAARRIFALLGAGGILGGIAGSYYTYFMAGLVELRWLLAHAGVALLGLQIVLFVVHRQNRRRLRKSLTTRREDSDSSESSRLPKSILQSSHFKSLAALVLMATLTSTLVDLLYKTALELYFVGSGPEKLTQFCAFVLGTILVFSAVFQLLGTTQILRRAGLGVGLLILPLALSLGSLSIIMTGVVFVTTFLAVVATKFLDDSLRRSVDRTSVELLYVPMPERQGVMFKSMMELVVARLGDGLGAAIFLCIITVLDPPVLPTAIAILIAACAWVILTLKVKEDYVQTLRQSLEFKRTPTALKGAKLDEAVADNTLLAALKSPNSDKVLFALQRLIDVHGTEDHDDMDISDISTTGLDLDVTGIYQIGESRWIKSVESLIDHADSRVGASSFRLLMLQEPEKYQKHLNAALASPELPKDRVLVYLETYEEDPDKLLIMENVEAWTKGAAEEQAVLLAGLIGKTKNPAHRVHLERWLGSNSFRVRRAALSALALYADPAKIPVFIDHLAHNWSRRDACRAMITYGDAVVPELIRLLREPQIELAITREIPHILTKINTRSSRAGLVASLYRHDSVVSYRALKGLNKIRDDSEELSYSQESFFPLLQMWAKDYYELINIETLAQDERRTLTPLMTRVVIERKEGTIEKIFRGLELYLPMGDAYLSYVGFKGEDPELRENAVELIDTRVRGELRQTLLPIFSDKPIDDIAFEGRTIFQLPANLEDALSEELFGGDPWFKCTIIAELGAQATRNWRERVAQALEDINPMVRETANWVLNR